MFIEYANIPESDGDKAWFGLGFDGNPAFGIAEQDAVRYQNR
jgi:hypothetical protein